MPLSSELNFLCDVKAEFLESKPFLELSKSRLGSLEISEFKEDRKKESVVKPVEII